jgi:hypothetical protein
MKKVYNIASYYTTNTFWCGANTLAYCARAWVMQQKRFYDIEPLIIIPLTLNNRTLSLIDESDE